MIAKVSEQGLLIPRELLGPAEEFEIRPQGNGVFVEPVVVAPPLPDEESAEDSIWDLGKNPGNSGVSDGSVNLDAYIYNGR